MLKLKKRDKYWHITGTFDSIKIRESTRTTNKKDAESYLEKRLLQPQTKDRVDITFNAAAVA